MQLLTHILSCPSPQRPRVLAAARVRVLRQLLLRRARHGAALQREGSVHAQTGRGLLVSAADPLVFTFKTLC